MEKEISNNSYVNLGYKLREIISENSTDIILDYDALEKALKEKNCKPKYILQLLLFLQKSNLNRYLSHKAVAISMIDINTIMINSERNTGMNRETIKKILIAVLYGLSMPSDIATAYIPSNNSKLVSKDIILSEWEEDATLLEKLQNAVDEKDADTIGENRSSLQRLADAGNPMAQKILGICFYQGICVEKDIKKAKMYLTAASLGGCIEARPVLGDCYYNYSFDQTSAFEQYASIGSPALSEEQGKNLHSLITEKKTNRRLLTKNGILLVVLCLFNSIMASGLFSINSLKHPAFIALSVILAIFYGLSVAQMKWKPYTSIQWLTPLLVFLQLLFTLFAF